MKKLLLLPLLLLFMASGIYSQSISGNSLPLDRSAEDPHFDGNFNESNDGVKIFIPNAFTPNGDGINDLFYIPNTNLLNMEVSILDRWGNVIFASTAPNFRWNGTSKGKASPTGVYVFLFSGTTPDGVKLKRSGTISLVR